MPAIQKALFVDSKSASLILRKRPVPKPEHEQLLGKIETTATFLRKSEYPALVGTDIAGVIKEVGEGASGFAKGDRVYLVFFDLLEIVY
ncbi:hypothetical protein C0991_005824 [Blastosporella zonata]|nr:hypothetical protein C0991_005824 [Blastosporella zonata]